METIIGILPFLLILLLCPLLMAFMMRGGHGGHAHQRHDNAVSGGDDRERLASLEREVAQLRSRLGVRSGAETEPPFGVHAAGASAQLSPMPPSPREEPSMPPGSDGARNPGDSRSEVSRQEQAN